MAATVVTFGLHHVCWGQLPLPPESGSAKSQSQDQKKEVEKDLRISVEPPLFNFGIIEEADLPLTETLTVKLKNNLEKVALNFSVSEEYLQVKAESIGEHEWRLNVTLLPTAPLGPIDDHVFITSSHGEKQKLLLLGKVMGALHLEPEEMHISIEQAKKGAQTIKLHDPEHTVVGLKVLSVSKALEKVVQTTTNQDQAIITYEATSSLSAKFIEGRILFEAQTRDGKTKKLLMPVSFTS
jgi:hypothetical protein